MEEVESKEEEAKEAEVQVDLTEETTTMEKHPGIKDYVVPYATIYLPTIITHHQAKCELHGKNLYTIQEQ